MKALILAVFCYFGAYGVLGHFIPGLMVVAVFGLTWLFYISLVIGYVAWRAID
jgi:hypothetical protein